MAKSSFKTRFQTPEFRGSFVSLPPMKPKTTKNKETGAIKREWEVTIVLPKSNPFWKGVFVAIDQAQMKKFGKLLPNIKLGKEKFPIKDADLNLDDDGDMKYPEQAGCYTARCLQNADKGTPGVVKRDEQGNLVDVFEVEDIYSGAWFVVTANAGGWTHSTGKGVSLYVDNVLKVRDDEKIGGGPSAEDDFGNYVGDGGSDDEEENALA